MKEGDTSKPHIDETITKEQAARRQLVTAIHLYFQGGDYVSILSLVSAAYTIARDLNRARKLNHDDMETLVHINFKEEGHKLVKKKFTEAFRFVKHADNDPDERLELQHETIEFWLLLAGDLYSRVTKDKIPEFNAYLFWFASQHPEVIKESVFKDKSAELAKLLKAGMSRKNYYEAFLRAARVAEAKGT